MSPATYVFVDNFGNINGITLEKDKPAPKPKCSACGNSTCYQIVEEMSYECCKCTDFAPCEDCDDGSYEEEDYE